MHTRSATLDDKEVIADLLSELRNKSVDPASLNSFERFIESDERSILLAIDANDVVVGMAVTNLVYKLPKIECRIDEVVIAEISRGNGYGKLLLSACEQWAWDHDATIIELTSRPSRIAANKLYQSIGFSIRETNVYTKTRQESI